MASSPNREPSGWSVSCRGRSSAFGTISPTLPSEANGSRPARWTFASVEISNSSSTTPIYRRRKRPRRSTRTKRIGVSMHGTVVACEPPRLLTFKFGNAGEVTFELTPKGKDVLLVLTHRDLADRKMMVGVSSGWHSHLAILTDVLNGDEPRPFWTTVTRMETEYEKRIPVLTRARPRYCRPPMVLRSARARAAAAAGRSRAMQVCARRQTR